MINKIREIYGLVMFSHSIFALPFALASLLLAANGFPQWSFVLLVILAMVFARNTAMAFNRLVDASFDAHNPRTQERHIPSGRLSKKFVAIFIVVNAALFIGVASQFNTLAFQLSPLALFIVCFYSLTKRWTSFTQLFLGVALGISPIAAWIAYRGTVDGMPLFIGMAVMLWVAGFDLIYATQDYAFDKMVKLKSMVVQLGIPNALKLSKLFHFLSFFIFILMGYLYSLSVFYFSAILIMGSFLLWEHRLVNPKDLSRIDRAFFTMNGCVSFVFLLGVVLHVKFGH